MTDKATEISAGDQAVGRSRRLRTAFAALGMLPVLILLAAGFQIMNPRFLTETNLLIVTQQSSINIVLAAGMTFVILTGGIDLSVGSILAASAMVAVMVSLVPEWGMLGVPAAILVGLGFGVVNGLLVAYIKL
ncbi:MAG: ribose ABC transporter permease, partial [Mesorhizobium sp.]